MTASAPPSLIDLPDAPRRSTLLAHQQPCGCYPGRLRPLRPGLPTPAHRAPRGCVHAAGQRLQQPPRARSRAAPARLGAADRHRHHAGRPPRHRRQPRDRHAPPRRPGPRRRALHRRPQHRAVDPALVRVRLHRPLAPRPRRHRRRPHLAGGPARHHGRGLRWRRLRGHRPGRGRLAHPGLQHGPGLPGHPGTAAPERGRPRQRRHHPGRPVDGPAGGPAVLHVPALLRRAHAIYPARALRRPVLPGRSLPRRRTRPHHAPLGTEPGREPRRPHVRLPRRASRTSTTPSSSTPPA